MNKSKINYDKIKFKITLNDNIFSIGSCFSKEISCYLKKSGMYVLSNPFGTVYNIHSIYQILKRLVSGKEYTQKDLCNENLIYFTMDHSTLFDNENAEKALTKINKKFNKAQEYLRNASVILITPGTSVVWEYKKEIIANCHRLPEKLFVKRMLTYSETVDILKKIIYLINENFKKVKIIFTLSPVRHNINDLQTNSYSKAILRSGIGSVVDNRKVFYFPSYEIAMDELRDYSCYKKDLSHLKRSCVKYIIDEFINYYFDDKLIDYLKKFKALYKESMHIIKDINSKKTLIFIDILINKINGFEKIKNNVLVDRIKINTAKNLVKISDDDFKKEKLPLLFRKGTNLYDFFVSVIEKKYEKLNKMKIKNKELIKIKNRALLRSISEEKEEK